jgi:hypothetical protein
LVAIGVVESQQLVFALTFAQHDSAGAGGGSWQVWEENVGVADADS